MVTFGAVRNLVPTSKRVPFTRPRARKTTGIATPAFLAYRADRPAIAVSCPSGRPRRRKDTPSAADNQAAAPSTQTDPAARTRHTPSIYTPAPTPAAPAPAPARRRCRGGTRTVHHNADTGHVETLSDSRLAVPPPSASSAATGRCNRRALRSPVGASRGRPAGAADPPCPCRAAPTSPPCRRSQPTAPGRPCCTAAGVKTNSAFAG